MRRELIHEIAEHVAPDIAGTYGLNGSEMKIKRVLIQFMDEEEHTDYVVRRAVNDIMDAIGASDAPWDDEEWFKPEVMT